MNWHKKYSKIIPPSRHAIGLLAIFIIAQLLYFWHMASVLHTHSFDGAWVHYHESNETKRILEKEEWQRHLPSESHEDNDCAIIATAPKVGHWITYTSPVAKQLTLNKKILSPPKSFYKAMVNVCILRKAPKNSPPSLRV